MVTDTLGQGTFGKVKLAQHEETGIEYAIKIMDKNSITENELTLNVRREIAIMRALNHRNIVNLREVLCSRSKYVAPLSKSALPADSNQADVFQIVHSYGPCARRRIIRGD